MNEITALADVIMNDDAVHGTVGLRLGANVANVNPAGVVVEQRSMPEDFFIHELSHVNAATADPLDC